MFNPKLEHVQIFIEFGHGRIEANNLFWDNSVKIATVYLVASSVRKLRPDGLFF